jgi:hypothetical protein
MPTLMEKFGFSISVAGKIILKTTGFQQKQLEEKFLKGVFLDLPFFM